MTLMFWINTLKADKMTVFSYAVKESAEKFELMVEREKIILYIQQSEKYEVYFFVSFHESFCSLILVIENYLRISNGFGGQ